MEGPMEGAIEKTPARRHARIESTAVRLRPRAGATLSSFRPKPARRVGGAEKSPRFGPETPAQEDFSASRFALRSK